MPKSTLGKQSYSNLKSEPVFGFGSGTRQQREKIFISKEVSKAEVSAEGPGAIYNLPASIGGKQPDGQKSDPPVWTFNKANRFPKASKDLPGGVEDPGHKYNIEQPLGRSPSSGQLSHVRSEPLFTFGTSTREKIEKASFPKPGIEAPGPGSYVREGSFGKIVNSRYGTQPRFTMSSRSVMPDGSKAREGGSHYDLPGTFMRQPSSRFANGSSVSFGTSTRAQQQKMRNPEADSPGPAAGYMVSGALGKQLNSRNRSGGTSVFSKDTRFKDVFKKKDVYIVPGPGSYDY